MNGLKVYDGAKVLTEEAIMLERLEFNVKTALVLPVSWAYAYWVL